LFRGRDKVNLLDRFVLTISSFDSNIPFPQCEQTIRNINLHNMTGARILRENSNQHKAAVHVPRKPGSIGSVRRKANHPVLAITVA